MGVPYVDHFTYQLEKRKYFCRKCITTSITNKDYMVSDQYVASSGKAALFEKVINLNWFYPSFCLFYILSPNKLMNCQIIISTNTLNRLLTSQDKIEEQGICDPGVISHRMYFVTFAIKYLAGTTNTHLIHPRKKKKARFA